MTQDIEAGECHIWHADLKALGAAIEVFKPWLNRDEIERAGRFLFDVDRRRWTIARGVLRGVLARYTGGDPREVRFRYGEHGKPELDDERLRFNLSHSGSAALVAVTRSAPVGIDIECMRKIDALETIARRFFAPREYQRLMTVPDSDRRDSFYRCWTRKEAYIKAVGAGISAGLASFEVGFLAGDPPRLLSCERDFTATSRWHLTGVDVPLGYAAAVCIEGELALRGFDAARVL